MCSYPFMSSNFNYEFAVNIQFYCKIKILKSNSSSKFGITDFNCI